MQSDQITSQSDILFSLVTVVKQWITEFLTPITFRKVKEYSDLKCVLV